ncbi:spore protease YyaC [Paenibacillus ginsengarvi]|uniref:spore protease YyaC n=1 Tax=Paenibacillus ginsengarvi TaxID=400777 RepID=UPI001F0033C3|nr:spore protease YyaC [Paenibacillus ginsengarvi]
MALEPIRQKVKGDGLPDFFRLIRDREGSLDRIVFVCIGTDRSTGDALGPLTGTLLREAGYRHVIGTLDAPCDASNLEVRLSEIPAGRIAVAIDACLGLPTSVGLFQVADQPLMPGKSVGRFLPPVGRYSIAAIVNKDGPKQYWILQSTSLHLVLAMARDIVAAVQTVFPKGPRLPE